MARRRRKAAEVGGYSIEARPSGRCRRKWDIWPYFQGSFTSFDVTVTRVANKNAEKQNMKWHLRFATGQSITGGEVELPPLKHGEKHTIYGVAQDNILGFSGDNILTIPAESLLSINDKLYETLYSFHVTPRVWLFLTLGAAAIAGLAAAGFSALFEHLSDP